MPRHRRSFLLLIWAPVASLAFVLASCSDTSSNSAGASSTAGEATGGKAGTFARGGAAGAPGMGGSGVGTSGSFAAGGVVDPGGSGGSGGTAAGGAAPGGGGTSGTAGTGGVAPTGRVYTIQGCADAAPEGGAGGSGGAGGDGAGGERDEAGVGGDGSTPTKGDIFASFSVYDFDTDKPVQTCLDKVDDFTITVTGDAPLTVVANFAPGLNPGSVIFTYDAVPQASQDIFPYALGFDSNGDYQEPTPKLAVGRHALVISAYSLPGGMGSVLGEAAIGLTVIDGAP